MYSTYYTEFTDLNLQTNPLGTQAECLSLTAAIEINKKPYN